MNEVGKKGYGKNWNKMNRWLKTFKEFFVCEVCGDGHVTLHHIVPLYMRYKDPSLADNPRFWMLLCPTCHWYANRYPQQDFQATKLIEYEKLTSKDGFSVTEYLINQQDFQATKLIEYEKSTSKDGFSVTEYLINRCKK